MKEKDKFSLPDWMKKKLHKSRFFITSCDDGVEVVQEKIIMALEKVGFFLS